MRRTLILASPWVNKLDIEVIASSKMVNSTSAETKLEEAYETIFEFLSEPR
jgi:hypothetical protein